MKGGSFFFGMLGELIAGRVGRGAVGSLDINNAHLAEILAEGMLHD